MFLVVRLISTVSSEAPEDINLINEPTHAVQLNVNVGVTAPTNSSCATSESVSPRSDISVFSPAVYPPDMSNQNTERDANVIEVSILIMMQI